MITLSAVRLVAPKAHLNESARKHYVIVKSANSTLRSIIECLLYL